MKLRWWERLLGKKARLWRLARDVRAYYGGLPPDRVSEEEREVLGYLETRGIDILPYRFQDEYPAEGPEVFEDASVGLHYMMWDGRRLYHRPTRRPERVRRYFRGLQIEQDPRSPHRYLDAEFDVEPGDTVLDVGAAEGNFGLSVVERAGRVVLFEPSPVWAGPLAATFAPWKDKVRIVGRAVSDERSGGTVRLDDAVGEGERVDFIKIDVEGNEERVLRGAAGLIGRQERMRIAVCTYHRQDDAGRLSGMLEGMGFRVRFTPGYLLYHHGRGNELRPPYLRRAVLRASRG
ncbi:MAG: FkbM family methyltransferase [Verrucomicrobiae bacterium]|nr:FkbM family methyltransferase [Verrucomicrobiae bacterium]